MTTLYLLANALPLANARLPEPEVVCTITTNPALLREMRPDYILQAVAHRLGLTDFEVVTADDLNAPYKQTQLPFPLHPVKGKRC